MSVTLFHMVGVFFSLILFLAGLFLFFGLTKNKTKLHKYGGAFLCGLSWMLFIFSLFPTL